MKYKLVIKQPEAELDLLESSQWYGGQKEGLGMRFIDSVEDKLLVINKNPLHYQVRYKTTRFALVKRFPFAIHFTVERETIFILAIMSTSRNPKIWEHKSSK
jgi:toxin ParE1/3/4